MSCDGSRYIDILYASVLLLHLFFFSFKQKTAYEMRISDWSSDVCSSDLLIEFRQFRATGNDRFYIGKEARHIAQVTRLAVAVANTRENPDNLEMALHARQVAGPQEVLEVRLDRDA